MTSFELSREHEEFRLRLQNQKEIELAGIAARRDVAAEQSKSMAEAKTETDRNP